MMVPCLFAFLYHFDGKMPMTNDFLRSSTGCLLTMERNGIVFAFYDTTICALSSLQDVYILSVMSLFILYFLMLVVPCQGLCWDTNGCFCPRLFTCILKDQHYIFNLDGRCQYLECLGALWICQFGFVFCSLTLLYERPYA